MILLLVGSLVVNSLEGCSEVNSLAAKRQTHGWKGLKLRNDSIRAISDILATKFRHLMHITNSIGQGPLNTHYELSLQRFATCASLTIFKRTHANCGCPAGLSIFPSFPS